MSGGRILFNNGCEVTTSRELIARAEASALRLSGSPEGTALYQGCLAGALEATVEQLCRDLEAAQSPGGSARAGRTLRERLASANGNATLSLGRGGAR